MLAILDADFSEMLKVLFLILWLMVTVRITIHFIPEILEFLLDIVFGFVILVIGAIFTVSSIFIVLGSIIFNTIREGWSKLQ